MDTSIKILLVDDDRFLRQATQALLRVYGFDSICVEKDGEGALQRLRIEGDVKLVLTDWNMPLVDGVELTRMIRATPEFARLKIIMMSGQTDSREPMAVGVDAYFRKPVKIESLLELIGMYFS